ncbi:MAG TPA: LysM peptidoglycan-binding domain-containing protein [Thermoanaerobaculia bacterium]|jgi:membrane-bound lytic murein transglycosylase D|nr:LysM peptidoglycan-binding domain-containing protein [Thermoanaerobaculia bacterium]
MTVTVRAHFAILSFAALVAITGCSSNPKARPVRVSYSEIPAASSASAQPVGPPAPAPSSTLPAKADPSLAGAPAQLSTREIIDRSMLWSVEGLGSYAKGNYPAAYESLNGARILLLGADMPEYWKEQGLAVLQPGLPKELRRYDLRTVFQELERVRAKEPTEKAEITYIDTEVRRILRRFGETEPGDKTLPQLVTETHSYVDFYRGRGREFYERAYLRKRKYWPVITEIFSARSLPVELGYIALVESGFNPRAQSHANAAGLWQFIPETGRRYGLTDLADFSDVRKSTSAAAEYLIDLLSIFGSPSFLLATASYNAGEGKIVSCLRQIDDPFEKRTFWEIRGCLATETREYIPRILAAAVIGSNPGRFGFALPSDAEIDSRFDIVQVAALQPLARLAELAGVAIDELRAANTDISSASDWTPGRNFPLYVPRGTGEKLTVALAALPADLPTSSGPEETRFAMERQAPKPTRYKVRRGDTLSEIADKFGSSPETLARKNKLRKPYRLQVGQTLVVAEGKASGSARQVEDSTGSGGKHTIVFTVRRGHTLSEIADLFAVATHDVMRWNDLRGSSLEVGQKLTLHPDRRYRTRTYQVRRGDKIATIARRFGVSIQSLRMANGMDEGEALRAGQKLTFYVPA